MADIAVDLLMAAAVPVQPLLLWLDDRRSAGGRPGRGLPVEIFYTVPDC